MLMLADDAIARAPVAVTTAVRDLAHEPIVLDPDDIDRMPIDAVPDMVLCVRQELARQRALFAEAIAPLTAALELAENRLYATIRAAGGTAMPHATLDVHIEQRSAREKRLDELVALRGLIPDDELARAIYATTAKKLGGLSAATLAAIAAEGGEVEMAADLRALDPLARKYGGEIAHIIEHATQRVPLGAPKLVVEPRKSAMTDATPTAPEIAP